jgi:hypothetical protein
MIEIICFIIGGALSGLMAGLLGIGGGLIVVPFLAFALPYAGFPNDIIMHIAVATSLANIVVTSIVSLYSHHKRGAVIWPLFMQMLPGSIAGAILGALLASVLASKSLQIIFALFVFFMAYNLAKPKTEAAGTMQLPSKTSLFLGSTGIAGFCSLLGMGGGSLMVPYFNHYHVPMRNAVGTSAACGFTIALAGITSLMLSEIHTPSPAAWMTGYLYWPAFITMSIASVALAPLGAKLAHTLPVPLLRRIFAGFLVVVGISMLYKVFG